MKKSVKQAMEHEGLFVSVFGFRQEKKNGLSLKLKIDAKKKWRICMSKADEE